MSLFLLALGCTIWLGLGAASFVFWFTGDLKITRQDFFLLAAAACMGPLAFAIGAMVHANWGTRRVLLSNPEVTPSVVWVVPFVITSEDPELDGTISWRLSLTPCNTTATDRYGHTYGTLLFINQQTLLRQARAVRNYSYPDKTFDAIPVNILKGVK